MKKTAKKAAKRPLARKVSAVHREREGKQKKKRLPPHVEEDTAPGTLCAPEPDVIEMEHRPECGWGEAKQAEPDPPYLASIEKAIYSLREDLRRSGSIVDQRYRDEYGPEGHCGDWVAIILKGRTQDEILSFVYEKGKHAWPELNAGQQRMCAGNVIRGLVRRQDTETMAWLLQTRPY